VSKRGEIDGEEMEERYREEQTVVTLEMPSISALDGPRDVVKDLKRKEEGRKRERRVRERRGSIVSAFESRERKTRQTNLFLPIRNIHTLHPHKLLPTSLDRFQRSRRGRPNASRLMPRRFLLRDFQLLSPPTLLVPIPPESQSRSRCRVR